MTEQEAIKKSSIQWIYYARTGIGNKYEYKPARDAINSCYLCDYSVKVTESGSFDGGHPACQACPYYKKYGFCDSSDKPYTKWRAANTVEERRQCAWEFYDHIQALQDTDSKSQLEEAEKPELRHGVCAIASGAKGKFGSPFIVIEQSSLAGSPKAFYGDTSGQCEADKRIEDYKILIPDIFDDLKAISEPLKEFKVGTELIFEAKLRNGDDIMVSLDDGDGECSGYYGPEELHEIILNLRRMEAGMVTND